MKIYGYCRVSTKQQNIERQIRNIKDKFPDAIIVTDEFTGTKLDRPGWNKIYKTVKAGDTIVFDQVSRMSRDADEGFLVYEELFNKGINLIFLKEPHINTETYRKALDSGVPMTGTNVDYILDGINKYLMSLAKEQIRLAFEQAQKEVDDLHQRTREGIETARLAGKQIGQKRGAKLVVKKSKVLKDLIRRYSKDFDGTNTDDEVMSIINGMGKIVYGTRKVNKTDPETGEKIMVDEELLIPAHEGVTKWGTAKNRYINRSTYYKYKREMRPYKSSMKAEELREKYIAEHESYIEKEVLRAMEYAESHGMKASKKGIENAIRAEVMAEADRYAEKYLSSMTTEE